MGVRVGGGFAGVAVGSTSGAARAAQAARKTAVINSGKWNLVSELHRKKMRAAIIDPF
jgi:hypothetical protein